MARAAHMGQKDKANADYIEHPLRVMKSFVFDEEPSYDFDRQYEIKALRIVAVLHDVLEDTWVTREYLERSGYAEQIIAAIESLTKQPDEEGSEAGYEKFIRRAAQNPLARQVKIADLKDNMDLSRIAEPTKNDHLRLAKYERAMEIIEEQVAAIER